MMNDRDKDGGRADFDDDDYIPPVPAGPFRVVLGLSLLSGGAFAALLSDNVCVKYAGVIASLASGLVMLKSPDKKGEN